MIARRELTKSSRKPSRFNLVRLFSTTLRLLLASGALLVAPSVAQAALTFGNLHAAEDFSSYGVVDDNLATTGATLNGEGDGLGTGFDGTWTATGDWMTDINVNRGETEQRPSTVVGGSGGPVLRSTNNTQLDENASRLFDSPITKPAPGWTNEFWLTFNLYNRSSANPGFVGFTDADGNVLLEAGYSGEWSSNAHYLDQIGWASRKFAFKGFQADGTPRMAATNTKMDTQDEWVNVVLRGLWADDGSLELSFWIDPDENDDMDSYAISSVQYAIDDDLAGLNLVQGRSTHWVAFDDIMVYSNPIPEGTLEGDLNGDGFVGGDDLDIVRSFWGQSVTQGDLSQGDPSNDGFVGGDDLDIVRANWGQGTPPAPDVVPEPNTFVLLLGGLLGVLFWLRRNGV